MKLLDCCRTRLNSESSSLSSLRNSCLKSRLSVCTILRTRDSLFVAASQAATAGFAGRISSLFSSLSEGRILANLASAFAVRIVKWIVAIAPKKVGAMYTFSTFQSQWPSTGVPSHAPSHPIINFPITASLLSRK